jgi:excisionase family DNA binding protein
MLLFSLIYLDTSVKMGYKIAMRPKLYTTGEAAREVGISRQTLQAWIASKRVEAPQSIKGGVRLWTEDDISKLARVKPRNYPRKHKAKSRS